jgi:hypothetical protein
MLELSRAFGSNRRVAEVEPAAAAAAAAAGEGEGDAFGLAFDFGSRQRRRHLPTHARADSGAEASRQAADQQGRRPPG